MNRLRDGALSVVVLSALLWGFNKNLEVTAVLITLIMVTLKPSIGAVIKYYGTLMRAIELKWTIHQQETRMSRRKKEWFKKYGYK